MWNLESMKGTMGLSLSEVEGATWEERESCVAFLEKDEKTLQKGVENDKITFLNSQEGSSLVCCGIQHGNDIVHKMKKMKKGRFKIPFHYMLTKLTTKHALLSSYAIIYETRTRDRVFSACQKYLDFRVFQFSRSSWMMYDDETCNRYTLRDLLDDVIERRVEILWKDNLFLLSFSHMNFPSIQWILWARDKLNLND